MLNSITSLCPCFSTFSNHELYAPAPIEKSWTTLPNELVHNILKYLSFSDLVASQRLDRRTAQIVSDNLMLPCLYWRKFNPAPSEEFHSREHYLNDVRDWLLAAGREDLVVWLDSLQQHKKFPQALFFAVSKTTSQADGIFVKKNSALRIDRFGCLSAVSSDGSSLVFTKTIRDSDHQTAFRILKLEGSDWKEECNYTIHSDALPRIYECTLGIRSMVIHSSRGELYILDREQDRWIEKKQLQIGDVTEQTDQGIVQFSADESHMLLVRKPCHVSIMERYNDGWELVCSQRFAFSIESAAWLIGHSRLYVSDLEKEIAFINTENNRIHVESTVQISNVGRSFRIRVCGTNMVAGEGGQHAIISFTNNEWKKNYHLLGRVTSVALSPDGRYLALLSRENCLCLLAQNESSWIEKNRVYFKRRHSVFSNGQERIVFGPDSTTLLASPVHSLPIQMACVRGKWRVVNNPCIVGSTTSRGVNICHSPNGQIVTKSVFPHSFQVKRLKDGRGAEVSTKQYNSVINPIHFTPDSRRVLISVSGPEGNGLVLYEIVPEPRLQPE